MQSGPMKMGLWSPCGEHAQKTATPYELFTSLSTAIVTLCLKSSMTNEA